MTTFAKIQLGLLAAGGLLIGWQVRQHVGQARELESLQAQAQTQAMELESRRSTLEALEQRNRELAEAERRAGNETLLSLLRERNTATLAAAPAASEPLTVQSARGKLLDSPEHWQAEQEYLHSEKRANLGQFFRLVHLPPEKIDAYIDMEVEWEHRKGQRLSALRQGRIEPAAALQARDSDDAETEKRRRELLGEEGTAFFNGIADGMRNDEANRLLKVIQRNMGGNELRPEQAERLQGLIKSEIVVGIHMDDVELFRPREEWARLCAERHQNVLRGAAAFLTPAQLEALRLLGAQDLAERQRQMAARRASLGIK